LWGIRGNEIANKLARAGLDGISVDLGCAQQSSAVSAGLKSEIDYEIVM